jgi:hypothetical protein
MAGRRCATPSTHNHRGWVALVGVEVGVRRHVRGGGEEERAVASSCTRGGMSLSITLLADSSLSVSLRCASFRLRDGPAGKTGSRLSISLSFTQFRLRVGPTRKTDIRLSISLSCTISPGSCCRSTSSCCSSSLTGLCLSYPSGLGLCLFSFDRSSSGAGGTPECVGSSPKCELPCVGWGASCKRWSRKQQKECQDSKESWQGHRFRAGRTFTVEEVKYLRSTMYP